MRLIRLIDRLWIVELIQIILGLDSHVSGINMIVGIIIFSIVVDLGFVRNHFRRCWILLLVETGLVLPRRQRILVR